MKFLLDMNLPPTWVGFLQAEGFEAIHGSSVGELGATDAALMEWARHGGYIVFTHDLDFSALLAATQASGPSVLQVRTHDVLPSAIGQNVVQVVRTHAAALEGGAIVTIDEITARVRILPIQRQ
jgi:predicted nuclease of predicted toxin-antitoxin system